MLGVRVERVPLSAAMTDGVVVLVCWYSCDDCGSCHVRCCICWDLWLWLRCELEYVYV